MTHQSYLLVLVTCMWWSPACDGHLYVMVTCLWWLVLYDGVERWHRVLLFNYFCCRDLEMDYMRKYAIHLSIAFFDNSIHVFVVIERFSNYQNSCGSKNPDFIMLFIHNMYYSQRYLHWHDSLAVFDSKLYTYSPN